MSNPNTAPSIPLEPETITINNMLDECNKQGLRLHTQKAYILATVEWETNHTFKPVKEAYWLSEEWRKKNLRYYPYYGRGYVQLTWKKNYKKYSDIMTEFRAAFSSQENAILHGFVHDDYNFVKNPDKVMEPDIAKFILVHGFKHGTFTGKKITNYITADKTNFRLARRCINGLDKADEIAKLAREYLDLFPTS